MNGDVTVPELFVILLQSFEEFEGDLSLLGVAFRLVSGLLKRHVRKNEFKLI
jgi:hypothetical protein